MSQSGIDKETRLFLRKSSCLLKHHPLRSLRLLSGCNPSVAISQAAETLVLFHLPQRPNIVVVLVKAYLL